MFVEEDSIRYKRAFYPVKHVRPEIRGGVEEEEEGEKEEEQSEERPS